MPYQKSRKGPEKFLTYEEVGAIAKATQEQIEKWVADGPLHIVKFQDEPRVSEGELNNFIDLCRRGVVRRRAFA
jgi:hypothetical protein